MSNKLSTRILFTLTMTLIMVYVMICYNIALNIGGLTNAVFLYAFEELIFMWPIAIVLELTFVSKLARFMTFKIIDHSAKPLLITIVMSISIVCIMCLSMSLIATLIFTDLSQNFIANFIQKTFLNFPMALVTQLFIAGPIVRKIFSFNKPA